MTYVIVDSIARVDLDKDFCSSLIFWSLFHNIDEENIGQSDNYTYKYIKGCLFQKDQDEVFAFFCPHLNVKGPKKTRKFRRWDQKICT